MSNDNSSSEHYVSIEERINNLKLSADKYDQLEDNLKIQQVNVYTQLITEKDECNEILINYKKILSTDSKKKKISVCDDKTFGKLMEQVHEIKKKIDQETSLNELIELYSTLNEAKTIIDNYLNSKKLVIKNI